MGTSATKSDRMYSSFSGDDARWEAVVRRDPAADGAFYYAVQTTGVYCRPSCAARLARREHVRFHATRTEAEQAGFRPCKRCRPHEAPLAARQAAVVTAACRTIAEAEELRSLDDLAQTAGMSWLGSILVAATAKGVCDLLRR
jgi:AraC family transcriptional regulator, regulatory protein of adaptative response / methylated-DNA-[protein]-cysteine methyltransferase